MNPIVKLGKVTCVTLVRKVLVGRSTRSFARFVPASYVHMYAWD